MKTMIKRNPMPTFFDEFLGDAAIRNRFFPYPNTERAAVPAVNVKESELAFHIEIAAPGMEKTDFKIALEHNLLSISTEKKEEKTENTEQYTRKEFGYMVFKRSFTLPENKIDSDKIEAKYEAGVLKLLLPKKLTEAEKSVKTIVIE